LQKKFVLPFNPLCKNLVAAAGDGSPDARKAFNMLVPKCVVRSAVRNIARACQRVPERYLGNETRSAIRQLISELREESSTRKKQKPVDRDDSHSGERQRI
jgi:hypothetical protein